MNILCALLMIICIILVLIELKIFNKIEVRMKKFGKNVIEQIINKITKKSNFSALAVFTTVIDFSIDYVIGEFLNIKAPKTIKDIKAKARSLG